MAMEFTLCNNFGGKTIKYICSSVLIQICWHVFEEITSLEKELHLSPPTSSEVLELDTLSPEENMASMIQHGRNTRGKDISLSYSINTNRINDY